MPKRAKELTALEVGRLNEAGLHAVGGFPGLYLHVSDKDGKSWILRKKVGNRRPEIGLGSYLGVTLAEAKRKAAEIAGDIEKGIDPVEQKRAAKEQLKAQQAFAVTFKECAEKYIEIQEPTWASNKSAAQWRSSLANYAYPVIGHVYAKDVTTNHLKQILGPIWLTKHETARRVRGRIEKILTWAQASGAAPVALNPARLEGHLEILLPSRPQSAHVRNHPAVKIEEAGLFASELRKKEGVAAAALEFLMLTAVRSANVRAMKWKQLDLEVGMWIIPGKGQKTEEKSDEKSAVKQRMKAGVEHRVPLSARCLEILRSRPDFEAKDKSNKFVFPSPRGGSLSDMAFSSLMREMNFKDVNGDRCVPHGLRSTFTDWAHERTDYPEPAIEMALAHTIPDAVVAAYRRGKLLTKRYQLMEDWATFCSVPETPGKVIPWKKKTAAGSDTQQ